MLKGQIFDGSWFKLGTSFLSPRASLKSIRGAQGRALGPREKGLVPGIDLMGGGASGGNPQYSAHTTEPDPKNLAMGGARFWARSARFGTEGTVLEDFSDFF